MRNESTDMWSRKLGLEPLEGVGSRFRPRQAGHSVRLPTFHMYPRALVAEAYFSEMQLN